MYTSFGGTNLSTSIGLSECFENQTRHGSGDSEPWETQLQVQEPISETRKLTRELNGLEMILTFISGNQDKDADLSCEDSAKVLGQ